MKHLDPCNKPGCKYNPGGKCCFAIVESQGCFIEDNSAAYAAGKTLELLKAGVTDRNMLEKISSKKYQFEFEGYVYTPRERADNQSCCPFCDNQTDNMRMIPEISTEKFEYLGARDLDDTYEARCFLCKKCGMRLWYHIYKVPETTPTRLTPPGRR